MAGGLIGMIVGGGLGNAIAAQAVAENPAADLLAKLQVNGDLDVHDKMALENLVGSYYEVLDNATWRESKIQNQVSQGFNQVHKSLLVIGHV